MVRSCGPILIKMGIDVSGCDINLDFEKEKNKLEMYQA